MVTKDVAFNFGVEDTAGEGRRGCCSCCCCWCFCCCRFKEGGRRLNVRVGRRNSKDAASKSAEGRGDVVPDCEVVSSAIESIF